MNLKNVLGRAGGLTATALVACHALSLASLAGDHAQDRNHPQRSAQILAERPVETEAMAATDAALFWYAVEVFNNTDEVAASLEMTFAATAPLFVLPEHVLAPQCGTPTASVDPRSGVAVFIDWGQPCVAPGDRALFIVQTPSDMLNVVGGVWRDEFGELIGPIGNTRVSVGQIAVPGNKFTRIVRQVRYIGKPTICTKWVRPPGARCWSRWCWWAPGTRRCQDRFLLCFYQTRQDRLLGANPICVSLGGFRTFAVNQGWFCRYETTTIKPDEEDRDGPPPPPPPRHFAVDVDTIDARALESIDGDTGGLSATPSSDWAAAFLGLNDVLRIPGTDLNELPPIPFGELLERWAPQYSAGAALFDAVIVAVDETLVEEPSARLEAARDATSQFQQALFAIADEMATGTVADATPYFAASHALHTLGGALSDASGGVARFENARMLLAAIAEGMDASALAVQNGLDTVLEQDNYLWGQVARLQPMSGSAGLVLMRSEVLQLQLADLPFWGPETVPVEVVVVSAATGSIVDEFVTKPNDFGQLVWPIDGDEGPLSLWIKPATHFAAIVPLSGLDGEVTVVNEMANGDADGDNCVDEKDIALITEKLGEDDEPADVNRSGLVDADDLAIAQANFGSCGAPRPVGIVADPCDADLNGDGVVDGADLGAMLNVWGACPGCAADLDGDGIVDGADLGVLLLAWGECAARR